MQLKTCRKCAIEKDISEMCGIYGGGQLIDFECMDESNCVSDKEHEKNKTKYRKSTMKSKEEKFYEEFGDSVNYSELIPSKYVYRDASNHYYDKDGNIYSWSFASQEWYVPKNKNFKVY